MRVEWLESFLTTAKSKSLTKASEELHMSQPALSKQMRKLEEDLGTPLFIRSASGVDLTKAGEILFKEIEPVVQKIHSIRQKIIKTKGISEIKIGTWPSIATFYLPQKLANAKSLYDDKKVSIKISYSFKEILNNLENGTIDVALLDERTINHHYWSRQLYSEAFYLFVNLAHPLAEHESISFNQLKDEPLLVLPPTCDVRILLEKAYELHNATLRTSYEIDFGQSILGFISANIGISILPQIFTHNIDKTTTKAIPIVDFKIKRTISVIAPNGDIGNDLFTLCFSHN